MVRIRRWETDRRRVALVGALIVVVVVGSVSLWGLSHEHTDDAPDARPSGVATPPPVSLLPSNGLAAPDVPADVQPADTSPIDPWYRRVLPVSGTIVGIGARASGNVRLARTGTEDAVAVHIDDLRSGTRGHVSVVLSAGMVVGGAKPSWTPAGESFDLFEMPGTEQRLELVLGSPDTLPDEVRSLVLLDTATGTVLGGAALLPSG